MKILLITSIIISGLAIASGTPEKEEGRKDRGKPGIKLILEKFDKNGDGKLCAEERKAAAEAMKKRIGGKKGKGPKGKGKGKGPKKPAKKK
jgi:hypothetical protein